MSAYNPSSITTIVPASDVYNGRVKSVQFEVVNGGTTLRAGFSPSFSITETYATAQVWIDGESILRHVYVQGEQCYPKQIEIPIPVGTHRINFTFADSNENHYVRIGASLISIPDTPHLHTPAPEPKPLCPFMVALILIVMFFQLMVLL